MKGGELTRPVPEA
jgi:hypothetical protein